MKRFLVAFSVAFVMLTTVPLVTPGGSATAYAESSFNLQQTIKRLKNNPKYRGKILGTRRIQTAQGELVEVRILKTNDKIIIVYIDPQTGGVVGDTS